MDLGQTATLVLGGLGAILFAVLTGLASNELSAWIPALTRRIVAAASTRLRDEQMRARAAEEWQATIADIPGPFVALLHALSLFLCVRRFERQWSAELSAVDVATRFHQLETALMQAGDRFRRAREKNRVSLREIARVTKIAVKALHALEKGQLRDVPHGVQIFAYMRDLERMLGAGELAAVRAAYNDVLLTSGGLPPVPAPTWHQRVGRIYCLAAGHKAFEHHVHSEGESQFHWCYRRCERCGDVSPMWPEQCFGRRVRGKFDVDAAVAERYSCDIQLWAWPYDSLELPRPSERPPQPFVEGFWWSPRPPDSPN